MSPGAGWTLSNGDFDGNGYVDLAVGLPGRTDEGIPYAGGILVRYHGSPFDGPDTRIGRSFPDVVTLSLSDFDDAASNRAGDRFGSALP